MKAPTTTVPATHRLLERARALAPLIAEQRDESDRERRLAPTLLNAFTEAGLFRMWIPRELGGEEADLETCLAIIEEISRADGSAGWNVMVGGTAGVLAGFVPPKLAREIFGQSADNIVAGALAPKGRAVAVDGGYRVSGHWPLTSGCQDAQWLGGGCLVFDAEGGAPRMLADGIPDITVMIAPADECKIIDNWHSTGLRGTGSHDFSVSDVFVPTERAISLLAPTPHHSGVLYRMSLLDLLSFPVAAVSLGIARTAIGAFVELAAGKVPALSRAPLRERATVQAQVAQAEALLRSARALMYERARDAWDTLAAERSLSEEQEALLRLTAASAAAFAAQAVDLMFTAAGTSSIYTNSPLDRCFRDVHVVTQHFSVQPAWYERTGQFFLGLGLGRF